jgi:hypothetical protein
MRFRTNTSGTSSKAIICLLICLLAGGIHAQTSALSGERVRVVEGVGDFGQPTLYVVGEIVNMGAAAYANLSITAQVFDVDGTQIGEGYGFLVNQCSIGLPPDFALQPNHRQPFLAHLEMFEPDAPRIASIEVLIDGDPAEVQPPPAPIPGITPISDEEVAGVEWDAGGDFFRFGIGCPYSLFTEWTWGRYDLAAGEAAPEAHPRADDVTDQLQERLGLDADFFARSMLRFAPDIDRLVFQDEINDVLTAAPDGRFQRLLYNDQHNRTLRGIHWLAEGRFIAYYFGAYGDPVLYFTADAEGRRISPAMNSNPPSEIVPGASRDGRRIVVAGTYDDERGYYLYVATNGFFERLFSAEPPGNNYPPPIPLADPESDLITRVYAALPTNRGARLVCFNRETGDLHPLTDLPLDLEQHERAEWWIAPDEQSIALAATGAHGGLWLIDLAALPGCD